MWADRTALAELELSTRRQVLDVGAGTGELTRVLRDERPRDDGGVIAVDADPALLERVSPPRIVGDATRLPVRSGSADLVVCQALLVNLDTPARAVEEFARVSTDRVAAIEPDNGAVSVESTVERERTLTRQARRLYLDGSSVDPAIGAVRGLFEAAGLSEITVRRYDHVRTVEPPYTERGLEGARRKASGEGLAADRETLLAAGLGAEGFDRLRSEWRAMGRQVIAQMRDREYRRQETVPFYVTVGRV